MSVYWFLLMAFAILQAFKVAYGFPKENFDFGKWLLVQTILCALALTGLLIERIIN